MLNEHQRHLVLQLAQKGYGSRRIAHNLNISRSTVRDILKNGKEQIPQITRTQKAEPFRDQILELYSLCKGNLVRVHEELVLQGANISYPTLTAFCRRHHIGHTPKLPVGHYDFAPGQEMQHDTSPHHAMIGEKLRAVQTASLVLCYSRMTFIQLYPRFTRFECKVFLTDAFEYFGGTCAHCMVDNTNVVRLKGTGKDMVPVPEMVCFGERFHFKFIAHEIGDANRSARVEGPFNHVDNNFLAGRQFQDWDDANEQARKWCDTLNAKYSRKLHASRRELFAVEHPALCPLPDFVPEVYVLHQRLVDTEGFVSVNSNRYSVPYQLISRPMEVRESKQRIDIFDGPRLVASHKRLIEPNNKRSTLPKHRPPRDLYRSKKGPPPVQMDILLLEPTLTHYVELLKKSAEGRGVRLLQRLLRMVHEYPREPLLKAVKDAEKYGMYDLDRLERMVLRQISQDYFILPDNFDIDDIPSLEEAEEDEKEKENKYE